MQTDEIPRWVHEQEWTQDEREALQAHVARLSARRTQRASASPVLRMVNSSHADPGYLRLSTAPRSFGPGAFVVPG
ncbi:hypothetical protein ASF58_10825 [Methylobacterium sp. Leaf125]|nr:hypothetical protein ASF58_10825 [Methylobacterium sp. Leaf125]